jgi:hypothetical protein
MLWVSSPHQIILRGYASEKDAQERGPFNAVGSLDLLAPGTAFVHATLCPGGQLTQADWRSLAEHIARTHKVRNLMAERGGEMVTFVIGEDGISRRIFKPD